MISSRRARLVLAAGSLAVSAALSLGALPSGGPERGSFVLNRYIGAAACKNCHKATESGEQYQKWEASKHAKAFERLGTAEAKELGAKHDVADPQKDAKCLRCHVTAFEKGKREIKAGFKPEMGVQCESCHGPGEQHAKARFAAASAEGEVKAHVAIPADEIVSAPRAQACMECHNADSPSFKPFCFKERAEEMGHLDPRKARSAEELAARKCGCGEKCECKQSECGDHGGAAPSDAAAKPDKEAKKGKDGRP